MTKFRAGVLGLLAAAIFLLVWALPAGAHRAQTTTHVTVWMGKPTSFHFTLSKTKVPHGLVIFTIMNVDKAGLTHNFEISKKISRPVAWKKTFVERIVFPTAGKYPYQCTVAGHADAGMHGVLTVT